MTRRDYVRLAEALGASLHRAEGAGDTFGPRFGGSEEAAKAYGFGDSAGYDRAVQAITRALAGDNPRFDADRFYRAIDKAAE